MTSSITALNHPIVADDVTTSTFSYAFFYAGSVEALLAANLVREEWLPGHPSCQRKCTFRGQADDGRRICVERKGRRFHIRYYFTDTEQRSHDEQSRLDQKLRLAQEEEARNLSRLPSSTEEYRATTVRYIQNILQGQRKFLEAWGIGYYFDADALERFDDACHEAVDALLHARVIYNANERVRYVANEKHKTAQCDEAFQAFVGSVVARRIRMK